MANNLTDYLEDKLINHCFRVSSFTMPAALAIALFTASPGETGAVVNEVTNANAYARAVASAIWATSSGGSTNNSTAATYAAATGSWGTVSHLGITDSATYGAGNMLWYGPLTTSKTITSGDTVSFPIGAIVASLD